MGGSLTSCCSGVAILYCWVLRFVLSCSGFRHYFSIKKTLRLD
jgi:hypothetical protein